MCPDLKGLSDEQISELTTVSKLVEFEQGHEVFAIEHGDNYVFVVVEGKLTLQLYNNVSKSFKEGALFGELTLFNDRGRLGTICCVEEVTLIAIDRRGILSANETISLTTQFKFLHLMGKKMVNYFYPSSDRSTEDLVKEPESEYLEVKESMSPNNWNRIIRTISAMMNLNGGSILIGINDETGKFSSHQPSRKEFDLFELEIRKLVQYHLGVIGSSFPFSWELIDDHHIVRIDVKASDYPVFYKEYNKKGFATEYFIVRSGNQNQTIWLTSEVITYIQRRFKQ
jgi:hypothetical protein